MVSENEMEYSDEDECEIVEDGESDSDIELEEICPLRDDAKVIFQGHTRGILCVTVDKQRNLAYTGGLDDKVIIWELSSGRMVTVLTGHQDSVTHVSIDSSGSYIGSGDVSGVVILWNRVDKDNNRWEKVIEIEASAIVGLEWRGQSLFIADAVGTVQTMNIDQQIPTLYKYGQGCSCSKFCLLLNGQWNATLYGESCGEHEDCGNTSTLFLRHNDSDRSVKEDLRVVNNCNTVVCDDDEDEDYHGDEGLGAGWANRQVSAQSHLIAIGDWGRLLLATMSSQGYTVNCRVNSVVVKEAGLVDNVALPPSGSSLPYVAFASKRGVMGVYDYSKQVMRYVWKYGDTMPKELRVPNEDLSGSTVSQLCWSPTKPLFYSAGLDGRLCEWDGRAAPTGDVPTQWGYSNIVWDMKVTEDGSNIVVASEDMMCRVFAL